MHLNYVHVFKFRAKIRCRFTFRCYLSEEHYILHAIDLIKGCSFRVS
jgi:hypothetical protein